MDSNFHARQFLTTFCYDLHFLGVWAKTLTIIPAKVSCRFPISNPPTHGVYEFMATTANITAVGSM